MGAEEPPGPGAAVVQVGTSFWSLYSLASEINHTQGRGGPTFNSRSWWIMWLTSPVLLQAYERGSYHLTVCR